MFRDVITHKSQIFFDKRGYFFETYNKKIKELIQKNFVQDNISFSKNKYTFRGIHFQKKPHQQGKLVTVLKGKIIDIVVNIDPKSKFYLKHKKFYLEENKLNQIYVPDKYAHGFLTLTDDTLITYKVTKKFNRKSERGINILDKKLKIIFKIKNQKKIILSEKDKSFKFL